MTFGINLRPQSIMKPRTEKSWAVFYDTLRKFGLFLAVKHLKQCACTPIKTCCRCCRNLHLVSYRNGVGLCVLLFFLSTTSLRTMSPDCGLAFVLWQHLCHAASRSWAKSLGTFSAPLLATIAAELPRDIIPFAPLPFLHLRNDKRLWILGISTKRLCHQQQCRQR